LNCLRDAPPGVSAERLDQCVTDPLAAGPDAGSRTLRRVPGAVRGDDTLAGSLVHQHQI